MLKSLGWLVCLRYKCVWIGVWPVIASLRQAQPLCRTYQHTSFTGHKIKGSRSYRAKEVKNNGELSIICWHQVCSQTFPGTSRVLQNRDSTALSAHHHAEQISKQSFKPVLSLPTPGLHWTFLEVARGNFSNFLGFIILQVMVCSKEQSSLIPQYKHHRHHSQLSHQSPDLQLRRAASIGKQKTRLSWSSYGPIILTAWKARL